MACATNRHQMPHWRRETPPRRATPIKVRDSFQAGRVPDPRPLVRSFAYMAPSLWASSYIARTTVAPLRERADGRPSSISLKFISSFRPVSFLVARLTLSRICYNKHGGAIRRHTSLLSCMIEKERTTEKENPMYILYRIYIQQLYA